jgi:thiamine biosynthesis protein ThiS
MDQIPTRIIVNDRERTVQPGTSVAGLLQELGLPSKFLAVELNRRVVPRADHQTVVLSDGDRIEVVTLVGGG